MLSFLDKAILQIDNLLRRNVNIITNAARPNPGAQITNSEILNAAEQQQSIAMLRVNHSGEVCAQALYKGQAFMAKSVQQYQALLQAANEENDHLLWCKQRLNELNGRTSLLNPIWFAGSYAIGVIAGAASDKISLGFLAETEHQVTAHLEKHLKHMSHKDQKSRTILSQMRDDEMQHATQAEQSGAAELPQTVKILMRFTARIMTLTAAKI